MCWGCLSPNNTAEFQSGGKSAPLNLTQLDAIQCRPPLDIATHTSGRAGRLAGRWRLARIQADNKITIPFSVLKLGNKSEFDKYVCWFQTFAVFWILYAFFWVISSASELYMPTFRNTLSVPSSLRVGAYPPMKMEQTDCSETLAYKIQTPGNYPVESIQWIHMFDFCLTVHHQFGKVI